MDNDYAWNKLANMLYVEIPSGVGFSYSDTPTDYTVGRNLSRVRTYVPTYLAICFSFFFLRCFLFCLFL